MACNSCIHFFFLDFLVWRVQFCKSSQCSAAISSPTGLTCSLEVVFILDSSESAKNILFESEKSFVLRFSTLLAGLQVDGWTMKVRMAALQYSSYVSIEHRFLAWKDLDAFHDRLNSMNYIGQGTYTTYAISNATQMLVQETADDSVRVAVLMTDGIDHPRNPDVIAAAAEAKDYAVKFFALGLSDVARESQNNAKLRAIASPPARQFVQSLQDPDLEQRLLREIVSFSHKCEADTDMFDIVHLYLVDLMGNYTAGGFISTLLQDIEPKRTKWIWIALIC